MFKHCTMEDIKHDCTFPHFMLPLLARVFKEHLTLGTCSEVRYLSIIRTGTCLSSFILHSYSLVFIDLTAYY